MLTSLILAAGLSVAPADVPPEKVELSSDITVEQARRSAGRTRILDSEEARRSAGRTRILDSEEARRSAGRTRILDSEEARRSAGRTRI